MDAEFTISIGLNDQHTHQQEISTDRALSIVMDAFGDCTIQICAGRYTHDDGTVVEERSLRVYVYADSAEVDRLAGICKRLKAVLNQESIVISWRPCGDTLFI